MLLLCLPDIDRGVRRGTEGREKWERKGNAFFLVLEMLMYVTGNV